MRNPMKSLFVPCVISKAILLISFNEHKLGHSNKQKEVRGETLHLTNFKWHNFLDSQVWLLKTIIMY